MAKRVPTLKRHEMINLECGFQTFQMFQLWMRVSLSNSTKYLRGNSSRRQIYANIIEAVHGAAWLVPPGIPRWFRPLWRPQPRSRLAQPCGRSTTPFCAKEASTAARSAIATMLLYRYTWGTPVVSLPILETSWSRCFVLKCIRSKRLFSVPSSSTARHKIPILTGENSRCSWFNPHLPWSNPFSRLNPQMST